MLSTRFLSYLALVITFVAAQLPTSTPAVDSTTSAPDASSTIFSTSTESTFQSSSFETLSFGTDSESSSTIFDSASFTSTFSGNISSSSTISSNASSTSVSSSFPMATGLPGGAGVLRVSATDPRINTIGADWVVGSSTCDPGQPSLSNTVSGESLSFSFIGTGIYMVTTSSNTTGSYSVAIDSQAVTTVNGFIEQSACGASWHATGLNNTNHTVIVTLAGGSGDAKRFELHEFMIQQPVAQISMQTAAFATPASTAIVGNATAAPSQGKMVNSTIAVNDPRIVVSNTGWDTKPSTCDQQVQSRQNSIPGQTLSFSFTGAAVFLAAARTNISGGYTVSLDGRSAAAIDGYNPGKNPTCGFSWSATSLDNSAHTVLINITGQSAQAATDGNSATTFEFQGFTIMQSASSASPSATTGWIILLSLLSLAITSVL